MNAIKNIFCFTLLPYFATAQLPDTLAQQHAIEEVVVTGQFQPTSLANSIYKVRSIDKETILRRGTTDMATLLNTQLGIRFTNDLTLGESDIQLMGMGGQNVKVLLDGVPIIDRGSTKQSLSQIDVNTIERIEIVEGPVSVMYGTDALAGVINIITIPGSTQQHKWGLNARVLEETVSSEYSPLGNQGRHNAHLGLSYQHNKWNFNWSGSKNDFGGYQGKSTGRALDWQPKDQWLSTARVGYKTGSLQAHYSINYLNEDLYTPGGIGANYKYLDKNFLTNRLSQVLQAQWKVNQHFELSGSFSYQNYQRKTKTELFDLKTQTQELTSGQGEQDVSKFNQAFARLNAVYNLNTKIIMLAGLEFDQDKGTGARIEAGSSIYDLAGYLSLEYQPVSWLMFRPGVRFIHNSVYNAPPAIPSINAKINLAKDWDLRLGYARGFRAPALRELYFTFHDSNHAIEGNQNLKAEHNDNYNASLNYQNNWSENILFKSNISSFYNLFNNLITTGLFNEDSQVNTYLNIGKFKTAGGTWENSVHTANWKAEVGLSYIGRYNDLYADNSSLSKFFWTPEVNATLTKEFPKWKANINLYYKLYGKRPSYRVTGTGDLQEISPAYQQAFNQLDLSMSKEFLQSITLQAGVRNLTNVTSVWNTSTEDAGAHAVNNSAVPISYGRSVFFGILYHIK